ncbi:ATP-grasp domain-containing protein [Selenomonas sp. TAMA-11512]|uniref:ATP-grasp domain-containing protein n=1 Tax=Selenomonas sp. TAMA-11512 TaxID=3095337 RepID=UPI00308BA4F3|nr:ATP-grasp domain-containing protein [Selenomonas sp. TAMA-11512]
MLFYKVLVTGCGGDIGLAIGRILQESKVADSVIGCDIQEDHAGHVFFDRCYIAERATSPNYIDVLLQLVEEEQIDLIIPSSEPELRTLYANDFFGRRELFLTANRKAMEIGFDKYRTAEFLREHGLPHPWTQIAAHGMPQEFPCILKSRTGCGSKAVCILTESDDYDQVFESEDDIFQELIEGDNAEYTCGLFRSSSGEIRSIIFRRKLRGGLTGSGIVETNPEIEELLHAIAVYLDLQGSINVQMRLRDGVPYVFEINPRFSSTVRFRHKLGFSDVLWSMQDLLHSTVDSYQVPMVGTRFYKIYEDVISS